jgi:uncharacterized repeat protein (TIGR03806 family)
MNGGNLSREFWFWMPALLWMMAACQPDSDVTTMSLDGGSRPEIRDAAPPQDAGTLLDAAKPDASPATDPCSPPAKLDEPMPTLRDTGCMDTQHPTQLAAALIPYEINSPLWSDSADKMRGMKLPVGAKIHVKHCAQQPDACPAGVADDGRWVFPVGSVFVKSFAFDGKLVETRLFVHFDAETWVGYSYQWNEQQTEANIVPDERRKLMFNTGARSVEWNYPSRLDCMKCHNAAGGSSLGPETTQMNRTLAGENQIDKLAALGLFDMPPSKPYAAPLVTPYASQAGMPPMAASVESKARSYLHANCGFCHRPDADFPDIDLRYGVALRDTNLCGVVPAKGDVGVPSATNLTPGKPMESTVWLRMHAQPGEGRMPQIGTYRIDEAGLALVGAYIDSIKACP